GERTAAGLSPPMASSLVEHDGGEPGAKPGASLEGVDRDDRVDPGILDDVVGERPIADDPRRGAPERPPESREELGLRRPIPSAEPLDQHLLVTSHPSPHLVLRSRSAGRARAVPGTPAALAERSWGVAEVLTQHSTHLHRWRTSADTAIVSSGRP